MNNTEDKIKLDDDYEFDFRYLSEEELKTLKEFEEEVEKKILELVKEKQKEYWNGRLIK